MLKNYLTIALRNLRRYKGYAFINVAGLAVGMACCLLILLYVRDERSYDRYHEHADQISRLIRTQSSYTAAPMGPALVADMPGVEAATRIEVEDVLVHREGTQPFTETIFYADSSFFDLFSFAFIRGNPATALTRADGLVLTASAARRYFGDADPMGQTLIVTENEPIPFTVTGVVKDVPRASHFRFELLGSFKHIEQASNRLENWTTNWLFTYLLLQEGTTPAQVEARLPAFFEQHTGEAWDHFSIQPLLNIHLHSAAMDHDIAPQGNIAYVYIFSAIAVLVLLIACINFMNLATARSVGRAREVGVRKVLGAGRGQLIQQFLGESLVMALGAMVLAIGLVGLLLPAFRDLTEKDIALTLGNVGFLLLALAGIVLLVGVVAGSYPAFFLSAFEPASVLKGKLQKSTAATLFRKGLVVFQFAVSIFLIVGTLAIMRQLDFVKNARLGFEKEQVVVLPFGGELSDRYETVKQALMGYPGVQRVSATGSVPGHSVSDFKYRPEGMDADTDELPNWETYFIDADFVETLQLDIAQGRGYNKAMASDNEAFLLNEAAVASAIEQAGEAWGDPVGKQLEFYVPGAEGWKVLRSGTVIGVVKDFHYLSLRNEIGPLALHIVPQAFGNLLVKVGTDDISGTLAFLEQQWKAQVPDRPFEYYFLDEEFNQLYRAEERVGQLFGYFSFLVILIACLGLFGLAAFSTEQRTKEIGIRKVLGASVPGLVVLLTKEFAMLVGMAFVVAAPVVYIAMNRWLEDFAYRIDLSLWLFVGAGVMALLVATLTVSYQAIKAALADPVKSLRYE